MEFWKRNRGYKKQYLVEGKTIRHGEFYQQKNIFYNFKLTRLDQMFLIRMDTCYLKLIKLKKTRSGI